MPDRPSFLRHLDESFLLAQLAASSASEAESMVAAAYSRTGSRADNRFELLRTLVRLAAVDSGTDTDSAFDTGGLHSETPDVNPAASEPPDLSASVIRSRVGRDLLDRYLLIAFTELPIRQRLEVALAVGRGRSAADAAMILGTSASTVQQNLDATDRRLRVDAARLAPPSERPLIESAALDERPVEAVQRKLVSILAPVSQQLQARTEALEPIRVKQPVSAEPVRKPRSRLKAVVYAILLVSTAGAVGYMAQQLPGSASRAAAPDVRDAVELVLQQAASAEIDLSTDHPEDAEQYVLDHLQWRITVPTIDGSRLDGVGEQALTDSALVPVLFYSDIESGEPLRVFVLTYAFLERTGGRVVMDRGVLQQIQVDGHFDVYDAGNRRALIFRNRDDIFLAVTTGSARVLRDRIRFPM